MFRLALKILYILIFLTCVSLNIYSTVFPLVKPRCQFAPKADIKIVGFGDPQISGQVPISNFRKHIDILGNDKYLAKVASTIRQRLKPDYAAVLGDLISSQWIDTEEFETRSKRFSEIFPPNQPGQLINITGNHDIGYHGDLTDERVDRYTKFYGPLNYVVFANDLWRLVVLNTVSLDGPPVGTKWQNESVEFIKSLANYTGSTILLTHIPLYKPAGLCYDSPHFTYYENSLLRSQNCLSIETSDFILNNLFNGSTINNNYRGVILTGHDHEGCITEHKYDTVTDSWQTVPSNGSVKEVTVRSIMGEYGGNSGLLSGIQTKNGIEWEFSLCRFHIQHIWWVTQVFDYLTIGFALVLFI